MKYLIASVFLVLFLSCSHSIKIYDGERVVQEITDFAEKDTTIQIKDYFITYRKEGAYIVGRIENAYAEQKGSFKASKSVDINIAPQRFGIREN